MIEDQLHDLLDLPAEVPTSLGRNAWARGRRRRHQQWGAGAAAGVVVAAGISGVALAAQPARRASLVSPAGFGVVTGDAPPVASMSATASTSPVPESTYSGTPSPGSSELVDPGAATSLPSPAQTASPDLLAKAAVETPVERAAAAEAQQAHNASRDPGLASVTLPDPAPGFPVRREPDSGLTESGFGARDGLAATWLLAVTPDHQDTPNETSPTGPQATVFVARPGLFTTTEDAQGKAGGYPVIAHTTARGVPAVVVRVGTGQTELLLAGGGFAVGVTAANFGPNGETLTVDVPVVKLVALADALQGIPAS